jgi:hypothetical protein
MRERYNEFRDALGRRMPAGELDEMLHGSRIDARGKRITFDSSIGDVPDGIMVLPPDSGEPHLLWHGQMWRWTPSGYESAAWAAPRLDVRVLTPKLSVQTIANGFAPEAILQPAYTR